MSSQNGGGPGRFSSVRRHKSGGYHAANNTTNNSSNASGNTSPKKTNPNRNKSFSGPSRSYNNNNNAAPMNDSSSRLMSDRSDVSNTSDDGFATTSRRNNNNNNNNSDGTSWNAAPQRIRTANKAARSQSFQRPRATPQHTQSFGAPRSSGDKSPKRNGRPAVTRSFHRPRPQQQQSSNSSSLKRANSRVTAHDVDLYEPGDGKNRPQRNVLRISAGNLLRCRLSYLDPPPVLREDEYNPHLKVLWTNEPTRAEQIKAQMTRFEAILKHVSATKQRPRRILSSKLGDPSALNLSASASESFDDSAADLSESMRDDSLTGRSSGDDSMAAGAPADIYNPLRQIMMLLNKLSWTSIGKLTQQLIQILESVPQQQQAPSQPPSQPAIVTNEEGSAYPAAETVSTTDKNAVLPTNVATFDNSQADLNYIPAGSDHGDAATTAVDSKPQQPQLHPLVKSILTQIVEKAQTEPHFSAMYAHLCQQLANRNTLWKKTILVMCQQEFEKDIDYLTQQLDQRLDQKYDDMATTTPENKVLKQEERKYELLQLRKRYLGHLRFIGELFKLKLIKLDIMIWCLARLLFSKDNSDSDVATEAPDEDDLECFARLMTTVGEQADTMVLQGKCHAKAAEKWSECWDRAKLLAGRTKPQPNTTTTTTTTPKVSSRIKFMFEDLLELRGNGWVERRQTETPKTIAEIHQEVKDEEAAIQRSSSAGWFNRRRTNSADEYNFSSRRRSNSREYNNNTSSPHSNKPKSPNRVDGAPQIPINLGSADKKAAMRRAKSDVLNNSSHHMKDKKDITLPTSSPARSKKATEKMGESVATPKMAEEQLDPEECKEKTKTVLKEYFVGGDIQEAILSIDELVAAGRGGDRGAWDRGAAVVEAGVLLVMEMKQQEVQKFLAVTKRCLQNQTLRKESLPLGLKDPLEFLSDIEIDAPMARSLLASIVGYWMSQDALSLDFLLEAPEYFRTEGKAAPFAANVVKVRGGGVTENDLEVIEKLMTEDDRKHHATAQALLDAQK